MGQHIVTIDYDLPEGGGSAYDYYYNTFMYGTGYRSSVDAKIPKFSVINNYTVSIEAKRNGISLSTSNTDVTFMLRKYKSSSYSDILTLSKSDGVVTTGFKPFQKDIANYVTSGVETVGKLNYSGSNVFAFKFGGTVKHKYTRRNVRFIVTFTSPTVVVNTYAQGGGTVIGGGTYEIGVSQGAECSLTATPSTGYRFVKWSDGNTSATRTVTVTQDDISANVTNLSYTAVFEKLTYAITASAGAGGTISPSGSTQVGHGDSKTYTITPNEGYEIESVTVDGVNKGAVSSFTFSNVTAAHTISVTFKQIKINPPEFTSASLTYAGSQVSAGNKVPAGESCILSVGVT